MEVKRRLKWYHFLLVFFGIVCLITAIDFIRISGYEIYPRRPDEHVHLDQDQVYRDLKSGITNIDWNRLNGTLEYISKCAAV